MMMNKILLNAFFLLMFAAFSYANESKCQQLGDVLGGEASKTDNVCDVFVPRNNLISDLNGFLLQPEIGIGLEVEFIPVVGEKSEKAVEGEIALLESEVQTATAFLKEHKFDITALHNHYLFETPKIMFLHFEKQGSSCKIAHQLRALMNLIGGFAPGTPSPDLPISVLDLATLNNILGLDGEIKTGGVYRADFQRPFHIEDNGAVSEPEGSIAIQGTMEDALIVGEVPVKVKEVQKFIRALINNNLLVSAVHNHELSEEPRVYYIHFQQSGFPATTLAEAARQALNTIKIENE